MFALALRASHETSNPEAGLAGALAVLPLWFVGTVLVLALMFWRQRGVLMRRL